MALNRPNVLLIVMDTARARTIFENEDVMPNFRSIANEGTLFTNAFTTAPWTLPSHASMFTGQYTSEHGTHAGTKRFDPDVPTLAERLQEVGYQTVAYSNNTWVSPEFGFGRGFEEFKVGWELFDGGGDIASISKEHTSTRDRTVALGKELFKRNGHRTLANGLYTQFLRKWYDDGARVTNWRIRRWLSKHRDVTRPFFLFINYLEPHLQYEPPRKCCEPFLPSDVTYASAKGVNQDAWRYICGEEQMTDEDFDVLSALYKGELAYLDSRIGELYEHLRNEGVLENTVLVIVGDHGENIGEHGLMDHQYCLYDTLLHVPLLVRYPEQFPAGEQCEELVEIRDILPTVLDCAGAQLPTNPSVTSRPLQNAIEIEGREQVLGEYITPQPSMEELEHRTGFVPDSIRTFDRGLRSVRTKHWKCIEGTDRSVELFDLDRDPLERECVAAENADRIEQFRRIGSQRLGELREAETNATSDMKASTERRLQDLGYL